MPSKKNPLPAPMKEQRKKLNRYESVLPTLFEDEEDRNQTTAERRRQRREEARERSNFKVTIDCLKPLVLTNNTMVLY